MRPLRQLLVLALFLGGIQGTANACQAQFDPRTNLLTIPCLSVFGDPNMYGVTLQDTGARNFVVAGLGPIDALNPRVIALRILTTPLPIAVIVVSSAASCTIAFDQPTFVQNGNNIDIRIKERLPDERVRSIALCAGQPPTAEAVHLVGVSNPMAHTYSVNGVAIAPSFSF